VLFCFLSHDPARFRKYIIVNVIVTLCLMYSEPKIEHFKIENFFNSTVLGYFNYIFRLSHIKCKIETYLYVQLR